MMNTTAFDGQWTRKVIEWLGFGTAQGSSSRGGLRGLAVMARRLEEGVDCAFTIDGPRGPRYVAKPGPVMLARKTGCPVLVFHIGVDRGKTFEKTWDHFLLPAPFARAVILFAPPIYVPPDANAEVLESKHAEMQRELERVRDIAESWFSLSESDRQNFRAEFSSSRKDIPACLLPLHRPNGKSDISACVLFFDTTQFPARSPSFTGISSFFPPRYTVTSPYPRAASGSKPNSYPIDSRYSGRQSPRSRRRRS